MAVCLAACAASGARPPQPPNNGGSPGTASGSAAGSAGGAQGEGPVGAAPAGAPVRVRVAYPQPSASQTPLWLAQEAGLRSEEHTSELQLRRDLVCRLL